MAGKLKARLFLNNLEKESLMELIDHLMDEDLEDIEDVKQNEKWAAMLTRLVLGKQWVFPLYLVKTPDKLEGPEE